VPNETGMFPVLCWTISRSLESSMCGSLHHFNWICQKKYSFF